MDTLIVINLVLSISVIAFLYIFLTLYLTRKPKNIDKDWSLRLERKFRFSKMRYEWGRWCVKVHPVEGCRDRYWWEWENK